MFAFALYGYLCHVAVNHDLDELLERGLVWVPAEPCACLCRVSPEVDDVCWTVEVWRYLNEALACSLVVALLVHAFAAELEFDACVLESVVAELANGVLHAGSDYEVLWLLLLEDEPHTLNIILCIAPVAERREVAEEELVLLALSDAGCSESDLACYEGLAATL